MIVNKITEGFVIQSFDTEKQVFTCQSFIAGDTVSYENTLGEAIDPVQAGMIKDNIEPVCLFGMKQPYEADITNHTE
jgi:hypothetical protein